jgi:kynurenine 3-monooxygenase
MARTAIIVGAGLGGSLLAHYLGERGWDVTVYERRGDPRAKGQVGGRSINLAISARGLKALQRAGLDAAIHEHGIRMPGRMLHSPAGGTAFVPYSADPNRAIMSFSRSALNMMLLRAAAKHPNVRFAFDHRCTGFDETAGTIGFERPDGGTATATADLVVGADGSYSAVRGHMSKRERFDHSQSYLGHGYKELTIPSVASGPHAPFAMEPNALHIWPRGGSMMIALPNPDGSFTCTLFWPHDAPAAPGAASFATVRDGASALAHFRAHYPDAVPLMPDLAAEFDRNPVGSMVTVRCWPWATGGRFVLLGDAAHAIVPFYGQGANASFEDCEALVDALDRHPESVAAAINAYQHERKPNADAIADMALANFIEMRDLTARRSFKWRKRRDHALHRAMPKRYVPLYDLVSFTTVPYAEARARAARQERLVRAATVALLLAVTALLVVAAIATWRSMAPDPHV